MNKTILKKGSPTYPIIISAFLLMVSGNYSQSQTLIFEHYYKDESQIIGEINAKHDEFSDTLGVPVGPILRSSDGEGYYGKYDNGYIYSGPETGAHAMPEGPILVKWRKQGSEIGNLGYPITDVLKTLDGSGEFCGFQGGIIHRNMNLGTRKILVWTSLPVIFIDRNFQGSWLNIDSSLGHLKNNVYETSWTGISLKHNLTDTGFNDRISSVFIPEGWALTLYENEGYCGKSFPLQGPIAIANLERYEKGVFNDDISSIKITMENERSIDNNINSPYGELVVNWVGVIDNKEGKDGIHGPYGNIHALVYEADERCYGHRSSYPVPLRHVVLPGPSNTGQKCEWEDGDEITYDKLSIFKWRGEGDSVKVFIYESDPNGEINVFGREHDPLFCSVINRHDTSPSIHASDIYAETNAIESGKFRARMWTDKVKSIFENRLGQGIPSMFIQFETVSDGARTYNDRKP